MQTSSARTKIPLIIRHLSFPLRAQDTTGVVPNGGHYRDSQYMVVIIFIHFLGNEQYFNY